MLSSMAHPNIVLYHDCFNDCGKQHIAMEFCEARCRAGSGLGLLGAQGLCTTVLWCWPCWQIVQP